MQDLHSITPDYFLEVSGAVIHPLSYQQVSWAELRNGMFTVFYIVFSKEHLVEYDLACCLGGRRRCLFK